MNLLAWNGDTACFNSPKSMYFSIGVGGGGGGSPSSPVMVSESGRDVLLIIECDFVAHRNKATGVDLYTSNLHAWRNAS
jgi:hypothetical protein